eukprot:m.91908 g.91908  ORF g.91908 m.91908 type:complete len:144 (-) comp13320_c0_seq10:1457-1888(-)
MQWRLTQRGYVCLDIDAWARKGELTRKYDVISCLNVLDRCEYPLTLLSDMRDSIGKEGRIILAVVLPFCPFVENGPEQSAPKEGLPLCGSTATEQVYSMATDVFLPLGLCVQAISRAPYLCEGDAYAPYYLLHDYIFTLSKTF